MSISSLRIFNHDQPTGLNRRQAKQRAGVKGNPPSFPSIPTGRPPLHGFPLPPANAPLFSPTRLPPVPVGNRDAALPETAREPGPVPHHLDDPPRLVHHETQCRLPDASHLLARVQPHPSLRPPDQTPGYRFSSHNSKRWLAEITGFQAVSLQPNAGAQGEYAGLLAIRAWHQSRQESHRNICFIPTSAHGTNPASAIMAGLQGRFRRLRFAWQHRPCRPAHQGSRSRRQLAALMVTYPRRTASLKPPSATSARSSTNTAARSTWTAPT
jgi:hypothetical protein